ncbi:MAG: SPFH domain-containing protein [Kofleriaceae bacterium]|nr:MAG: SPFH domain-containing protein [Kofleriaceae bacterium]MBZ0232170.1 SPFH domain-containing protein [Kofleriaceae bacterium]
MFGIAYLKTPPTTYVLHYKNGKVKREGRGLSFLYYAPTSTLVLVPQASADLPFVWTTTTADFQEVTIQGQLTYRVDDPRKLAALLDFTVDAAGRHRSEDPDKLEERLVHVTQVLAQAVVGRMTLRQALASSAELVTEVSAGLRASEPVAMLGVEPLALTILAVRPTPEMARALEAEAREQLQREADSSIYARRNAAVEQERIIKESELNTELAVETKKKEIREKKMAADIAVEEQRAALIARQVENDKQAADSRAYALEATLAPLRQADWKTLMAVSSSGADPRLMIALAFRELAENAEKIGELNMSPDLLKSLLAK